MDLPAYRWRFVHLAALWGYGVSQPVFSMLKGNPEFLIARGSTRSEIVVFALVVAFVPPLFVLALEAVTSVASGMLSRVLHIVAVWGFAFLAVLQLTRLIDVEGGVALWLPVAPAMVVALLYLRLDVFRSFLSLSFTLPVFATLAFMATVPLAIDDAPGANVTVPRPVSVVLLTLDEFPVSSLLLPDGSIDAVRYPNFARLAREGTWYRRATAVHEFTTQAVPAILTGISPKPGQLPTLADHRKNLFTLLGEKFALHVNEQRSRLCPSRYCPQMAQRAPLVERERALLSEVSVGYLYRVLPHAVVGDLAPTGEQWGNFRESSETQQTNGTALGSSNDDVWLRLAINAVSRVERARQFVSFVDSIQDRPGRPQLYFEHVLLPHTPWRFLPSGHSYPNSDAVTGMNEDWSRWRSKPGLVETALQRHLLQLRFVDRLLGVLLRRLETTGLYDHSLVIVAADHGASFRPNGYMRTVVPTNLPDIAGVPLFVKYPGQRRGKVDGRGAKTIDIIPTIADVLGVRIPWHVDGVSLRAVPVSRPISVLKDDADPVVGELAAVEAGVLATARRNASLFGVGRQSMYRIGPYPGLLGMSPTRFAVLGTSRDDVRIDNTASFANVRLSSGLVPARVAGTIGGDTADGTSLAVAVDGRVRATAFAYEIDGKTRFEAMVPETSFREGRNSIDIYAVSRSSGAFRLLRLGGTSDHAYAPVLATAASTQGPEQP